MWSDTHLSLEILKYYFGSHVRVMCSVTHGVSFKVLAYFSKVLFFNLNDFSFKRSVTLSLFVTHLLWESLAHAQACIKACTFYCVLVIPSYFPPSSRKLLPTDSHDDGVNMLWTFLSLIIQVYRENNKLYLFVHVFAVAVRSFSQNYLNGQVSLLPF